MFQWLQCKMECIICQVMSAYTSSPQKRLNRYCSLEFLVWCLFSLALIFPTIFLPQEVCTFCIDFPPFLMILLNKFYKSIPSIKVPPHISNHIFFRFLESVLSSCTAAVVGRMARLHNDIGVKILQWLFSRTSAEFYSESLAWLSNLSVLAFIINCFRYLENIIITPIQCKYYIVAVNNLPMGYPVLQQPLMPAPGQPHIDPMVCGLSSGHMVNGIPAPGGYHPIHMNSGNE